MRDLAFTINPKTGRLTVARRNGQPYGDDSRYHAVMSRLAARRATWWADGAGSYGRRDRKGVLRDRAVSDLEADVREALAPLVAAKEILPRKGADAIGVTVTLNRAAGAAVVVVAWLTPGGNEETARAPLRF